MNTAGYPLESKGTLFIPLIRSGTDHLQRISYKKYSQNNPGLNFNIISYLLEESLPASDWTCKCPWHRPRLGGTEPFQKH